MKSLIQFTLLGVLGLIGLYLFTYSPPANSVVSISQLRNARELAKEFPTPSAPYAQKLEEGSLTLADWQALTARVTGSAEYLAKVSVEKQAEERFWNEPVSPGVRLATVSISITITCVGVFAIIGVIRRRRSDGSC